MKATVSLIVIMALAALALYFIETPWMRATAAAFWALTGYARGRTDELGDWVKRTGPLVDLYSGGGDE
jgi:peptidoglycan/LPS O-acetylase OafA/YrhL